VKILFVYTDINVRGGALSYQFGIGQLSAVLRQHGHATRLHYMFGDLDLDALRACVAEYKPDVVGFTLVYPQYRFVKKAIEALAPWPAFTICGGAHTSVMPNCLEDIAGLDAICIGEGEYPMLDLVKALEAGTPVDGIPNLWIKKPDGTIIRNKPRPFIEDLNELPFYDREFCDYQAIIDSDFKVATFQFGRGCPFSCTYCSNHIIRAAQEGRYVRFRSVAGALEEVRQVVNRFDVKSLYFNDDTFMVNKPFFEGFCEQYPREFSYPFLVNARPEQINEDVCRRLKEAGCTRVTMGVEHGDEQYRAEVLGRRMTNATIIQAFDLCRKYGLKTKAHNLVGLPHETPAIHMQTVELNARILPDSFNLHIFEPYPGTTLGDVCVQENLIDTDRQDAEFVGQTDTILKLPGFPREEILRNFRLFGFRIYRKKSLLKALPYYVYYSRYGEALVRLLQPVKRIIRRLAMGV
jgi:anaerobic magnesium-protoporphyrin IX monomethyl ester cyclase